MYSAKKPHIVREQTMTLEKNGNFSAMGLSYPRNIRKEIRTQQLFAGQKQ